MAHQQIGSWTGYQFGQRLAKVAELVDALDLGSSGATRGSSSLPFRTNIACHGRYDENTSRG